jgi:TnpA family transposase
VNVREFNTLQKRLNILGEDEIEALYGRPRFTHEERIEYFSLSPTERSVLAQLHSIKSQLCFVLQLGYFKARHQFFIFSLHEVAEDAKYVQAQYFPGHQVADLTIAKVTRIKQQGMILELLNYRYCDTQERQTLQAKARQAARIFGKPVYVFRELMHYLQQQRIVAPGYSFLQDTVGQALLYEQNRLIAITRAQLNAADIEALNALLDDSTGLYEITQLKREPKDFSNREIKREIQRGEQIRPLYGRAQQLLPALGISNESVKYYASLVTYYSIFRLKQLSQQVVYIYLLCFVYHRYQRVHDILINSLLYYVKRYGDAAKEAAKERVYECRIESDQNLKKVGQILKLFTTDEIAEDTPFQQVQSQAFAILERQKIDRVADYIATQVRFDETAFQWDYIDQAARQFKLYLRPILHAVEFAASPPFDAVIEAVDFLKDAFEKGRTLSQSPAHAFPTRFIPDNQRRYIFTQAANGQRVVTADRYEFLVYRLLRQRLEAGDIFCCDSVRFRSFEDDLIDDQRWQQKTALIESTGLGILQQPIREHLAALEQQLESRIARVNQRIESGENAHFKIKRRGSRVRWSLQYPPGSEPVNHPFYDALKQIDIASVLHFTHECCQFMDTFEHVLSRFAKQEADLRIIVACLIAWGTNLGLGRMGESSDLGYATLSSMSNNFIRLETLQEANDEVSNATAELPIFHHYDIDDTVHSSSDGQKFETQIHTVNARHSPKYFGLKKGVVSYAMVANHVPVNATIIGAHEHESHHVFDIVFNNTTDIQPELHSTDTHGTNEVNFAILHIFGYQFAPRYKDIRDKVQTSLYGFKHPSQYDGLIKPTRKVNDDLITDEWENIQRIMVSLALKTTTQSIIVGKLSSYARKNKTRRALWEYDGIIRSLFLLEYIDSPPLRRNVQRALNRGENYHKLRRAVSYANFGKLRFKTEYEQQIWGECARLITNCVIFYNASILSNLLEYRERIGDIEGAEQLKQVSPVAWQHVNFFGRYEFGKRPQQIDMKAIVEQLARVPVQQHLVD